MFKSAYPSNKVTLTKSIWYDIKDGLKPAILFVLWLPVLILVGVPLCVWIERGRAKGYYIVGKRGKNDV